MTTPEQHIPRLLPDRAPRKEQEKKVKISLVAEHQKFGKKSDYTQSQPSLFPSVEAGGSVAGTNKEVNVTGLDLSTQELYALFALQKIFDRTNYQGNVVGLGGAPEMLQLDGYNSPARHIGQIPYFQFSRAEFLEAYGLDRHDTERGKREFSGRDAEAAVATLLNLFSRRFTIDYTYRYNQGKREEIDLVRVEETLIEPFARRWEGLTEEEYLAITKGDASDAIQKKLKTFIVRPSVLLLFIREYFALKPYDFHEQIDKAIARLGAGKKYTTRYTVLACEYVWLQGVMKRIAGQPLKISRTLEHFAYHLRMVGLIKKREWQRIRDIIAAGLDTAREMGLVDSYLMPPEKGKDGLVEISLNPAKFPSLQML